jgi:hypothetical protein
VADRPFNQQVYDEQLSQARERCRCASQNVLVISERYHAREAISDRARAFHMRVEGGAYDIHQAELSHDTCLAWRDAAREQLAANELRDALRPGAVAREARDVQTAKAAPCKRPA